MKFSSRTRPSISRMTLRELPWLLSDQSQTEADSAVLELVAGDLAAVVQPTEAVERDVADISLQEVRPPVAIAKVLAVVVAAADGAELSGAIAVVDAADAHAVASLTGRPLPLQRRQVESHSRLAH